MDGGCGLPQPLRGFAMTVRGRLGAKVDDIASMRELSVKLTEGVSVAVQRLP